MAGLLEGPAGECVHVVLSAVVSYACLSPVF